MNGILLLDGSNITARHDIAVRLGSYGDLLAYPPLSEPYSNEWHDIEGYEYDLSAPTLAPRTVSLTLINRGGTFGIMPILLGSKAVHTYTFPDLRRTYRLRYVGVSDCQVLYPDFSTATLTLSEDAPETPVREKEKAEGTPIDLYRFGVKTLLGTLSDVARPLPAKENLITPLTASGDGAQKYDDFRLYRKPMDVVIPCLMMAQSVEDFNTRHDALLSHLLAPGIRPLSIEGAGTFRAFYRSCSTVSFHHIPTPVWWRFDLTFTINEKI